MSGFQFQATAIENPETSTRSSRHRLVFDRRSDLVLEPLKEGGSALSPKEAMAQKTIFEHSAPSADNVATGPQLSLGDVTFELKPSLINMVQANPFSGKPHEDANAHL